MGPDEARSGEIATPPTPQLSRLSISLAVAALVFFAFYVIQFRGYTMDDAYMSYRYAEHLATGQGLVFNPGENPRSEGVTSPLWAGLLSLCYLLGSDLRAASKAIGLVCALLTVGLLYGQIYTLCRRQLGRSGALASAFGALGALTYLSDPYVAGNAVSGMETALGTLVYCAFLFGLVNRLDALRPRDIGLLGLAAVAMCGLRPELGLSVVAALALAVVLCRGSRLPLLAIGGLFVALGAGYFAWRYSYYGLPFPLPFYVKQLGWGFAPGLPTVSRGLRRFGLAFPLFALLLSWLTTQKAARGVVLLAAVTGIQTAYYVLPVHEMGFGYRYLQPVMPGLVVLLLIGLALALELLERLPIPRQFSKLTLTFACLVPLLAFNLYALSEARSLYLEWYWRGLMPRIIVLGHTLHAADSTGTLSVALNDCGVIPYYSRWRTVDLTGLNNRNIARQRSPEGVLEEVVRQRPELLVLGSLEGQRYKRMFRNEELLHDRALAIGYAYMGTIPIAQSYYYWTYWRGGCPPGRVIELLKQRCGLCVAEGEGR